MSVFNTISYQDNLEPDRLDELRSSQKYKDQQAKRIAMKKVHEAKLKRLEEIETKL